MKSIPPERTPDLPSGPAVRLIRVLIDDPDARAALIPEVRDEDLAGGEVARIWSVLRDLVRSGQEITYPRIGSLLADPEDQALLVRIASLPAPVASPGEGESCLRRLREAGLARRLQELQDNLEKAEPGASLDDLLREKIDLRKRLRALRVNPVP